MFEKIYDNSDKKNVSKYVLYAEEDSTTFLLTTNGHVYEDSKLKKALTSDELEYVFHMGCIIKGVTKNNNTTTVSGSEYSPSMFYKGSGYSSVYILAADQKDVVNSYTLVGSEFTVE